MDFFDFDPSDLFDNHSGGHGSAGFAGSMGKWFGALGEFILDAPFELFLPDYDNKKNTHKSDSRKNLDVIAGVTVFALTAGAAFLYVRHKQKQIQKQKAEYAAWHRMQHITPAEHIPAHYMNAQHMQLSPASAHAKPAHAPSSFAAREQQPRASHAVAAKSIADTTQQAERTR